MSLVRPLVLWSRMMFHVEVGASVVVELTFASALETGQEVVPVSVARRRFLECRL